MAVEDYEMRDTCNWDSFLSPFGKAKILQAIYICGLMIYIVSVLPHGSLMLSFLFFFNFIAFLASTLTLLIQSCIVHKPSLIFKTELYTLIVLVVLGIFITMIELYSYHTFKVVPLNITEGLEYTSDFDTAVWTSTLTSSIVVLIQICTVLLKYCELSTGLSVAEIFSFFQRAQVSESVVDGPVTSRTFRKPTSSSESLGTSSSTDRRTESTNLSDVNISLESVNTTTTASTTTTTTNTAPTTTPPTTSSLGPESGLSGVQSSAPLSGSESSGLSGSLNGREAARLLNSPSDSSLSETAYDMPLRNVGSSIQIEDSDSYKEEEISV